MSYMLKQPTYLTVKNDKLVLAQEGEQLITLDENHEYIIDAEPTDPVLAIFDSHLGFVDQGTGNYWDGQPVVSEVLDEYNAADQQEENNGTSSSAVSESASSEKTEESGNV